MLIRWTDFRDETHHEKVEPDEILEHIADLYEGVTKTWDDEATPSSPLEGVVYVDEDMWDAIQTSGNTIGVFFGNRHYRMTIERFNGQH